jgi:hypothetical protein
VAEEVLLDALDGVPNDDIVSIFLAFRETNTVQRRLQIASQRHLTNGWKEQFREVSDKIRLSGLVSVNIRKVRTSS